MPHTDQIPARADPLPTAFGCTATHGGLDAAWVSVVDIYRMFTLTGSTGDVDIADRGPLQPPAPALQRSLVSQSLLRTG